MLFRLVAFLVLAPAMLAASVHAQPVQLMPGVTSERQVQFTPHGPVAFTVITAPVPGSAAGLYQLQPVLANGPLNGPRKPLTQIQRELGATAVTVGINGDAYNASSGLPNGIFVQGGLYQHGPTAGRSSIGFDATGALRVTRFSFAGTWRGTGQRRPLAGINQKPKGNQTVLFTPAWGAALPSVANAAHAVLQPFPAAKPNTDLVATVLPPTTGPPTIPPDGAVLMSTGAEAAKLTAEAPEGTSVTTRLILPSSWAEVTTAIGGGPVLVRNRRPVFRTSENFDVDSLMARDARGAVGQLADGRVILVAVDGNQPGYSVGMTTYELAQTMARLGAVTAAAVEPGRSVTAAFQGELLNRPSDPAGRRPIRQGLLVHYYGAYAAPPSAPLVGKHNAGAGERLAYTVSRPSAVRAVLLAPDGSTREIDTNEARQPGTYRFSYSTLDVEGTWRWQVAATDDLNRQSNAERTFTVDFTLSGLRVSSARTPRAAFALSRAAGVVLQIETRSGTVVTTRPAVELDAGAQALTWDGATAAGVKAPNGSYVARVTASSEVGTMELTAPFTLRR
jgi:hypothetical protein